MKMIRRNFSLLSKFKSKLGSSSGSINHDVSEAITENIPKSTGNGPFIELPKFEAIGQPASLLNVTLPASSKLNIRNGSIVAMNGELNNLSTSLKNLSNIYPLIYQELKSVSPVSILISGGKGGAPGAQSFTVLEISGTDNWVIADLKNVIAWTGYDFQLVPHSRQLVNGGGLFKLENFTGLRTSGKGKVVLSGTSELFDVELSKGEELLLEPSCLIAHNTLKEGDSAKFDIIKGESLVQMPSFTWVNALGIRIGAVSRIISNYSRYAYIKLGGKSRTLTNQDKPQDPSIIEKISSGLSKVIEFISNQFSRLSHKEVYYHVQGPCKLLISSSNGGLPSRKTFTKQDLQSIYDTLK